MKSIVMFFDGTWNYEKGSSKDPAADTNIVAMKDSVPAFSNSGLRQAIYYRKGVGTDWWNRIRGGAFGLGIDENIMHAYQWLAENCEFDGSTHDNIFVAGFSRGAYTARSLIGMIRSCGLLHSCAVYNKQRPPRIVEFKHAPVARRQEMVEQAYEIYRTKSAAPSKAGADSEDAKNLRKNFSHSIQIEGLFLWDTVGALGIPVSGFGHFNRSRYDFHDTTLSGIVRNAFHALAIDEHRAEYAPTLWGPLDDAATKVQRMEQVWFAGAHADVGGGYDDNRDLANISLRWMQERAVSVGLCLDSTKFPTIGPATALSAPMHDSYSEFLGGRYSRLKERHFRLTGHDAGGPQLVHWSVKHRLFNDTGYRPKNAGLRALLDSNAISLDSQAI